MEEDGVVFGGIFLAGHLVPHLEATLKKSAVILRRENMPSQLKVIQDWSKSREKPLGLSRGFEPPHLFFTQSRGLVGVFRSIVEPFVLAMLYSRQDLAFGRSIALQLVGDNHARDVLQPFEELPKKSFARLCVALTLHQDIQHVVYDFRSS